MTVEIVSPQTPAVLSSLIPSGDVITHSNVKSIEAAPCSGPSKALSIPAGSASYKLNEQEQAEQRLASDMQLWWDESMSRNMNLPLGYSDVNVLIIKWEDEYDRLDCGPEVKDLQCVFEDKFNYRTQVLNLGENSPQLHLNAEISQFVYQNNGPNKLMIIYYTGHGSCEVSKNDVLLLSSGLSSDSPTVNFNQAEEPLLWPSVNADILTILDSCFSSNIQKSRVEDTRAYELLSACGINTTTAGPGDMSFTRALIKSLNEAWDQSQGDPSLSTWDLQQRINQQASRHDTPSQLWNRLRHHDRHIRLTPLEKEDSQPSRTQQRHSTSVTNPYITGYLNLRFALQIQDQTHLKKTQIEALSKDLRQIFNIKGKLSVSRIDWMGIKKPADLIKETTCQLMLARRVVRKWKNIVLARKQGRKRRSSSTSIDSGFAPEPPLKRTRAEGGVKRKECLLETVVDVLQDGLMRRVEADAEGPLTPNSPSRA